MSSLRANDTIKRPWLWLGLLVLGSLALHAALIPSRGWVRDLRYFDEWMRAARKYGVAQLGDHVWCNYPPVYLYLLDGLGRAWTAVTSGPPPAHGTLASRYLLKLLPTLATLATAVLLFRLARSRVGAAYALLVGAAYAYNPALLFDSAVWGQADSILALLLLIAVSATASGNLVAGFAWLATALLFKQQAIVAVPPLLLFAVHRAGIGGLLTAALGAGAAGSILLLPFLIEGTIGSFVTSMQSVTNQYPFVSMNAHNLWWLIAGRYSPTTSDVVRIGNGLITYRIIGFALLGIATAMISWRLWRNLRQPQSDPLAHLAEACGLQFLAFYLFPTQIHERYLVPGLVFLALSCVFDRRAWWLYALLSLACTVSLASTLMTAYPQPIGPLALLLLPRRAETTAIAWLLLAAFVVWFARGTQIRFLAGVAATAAVALSALAAVALVPLARDVRLCEWPPTRSSQGWGKLQMERSVGRNRLTIGGIVFEHGIGTHAPSRLRYSLNGAFRHFEAGFGLDDEANRGQRAQFRVLVDDALRFDSGVVAAGSSPGKVAIGIAGAQHLTLEVLAGGDSITHDHADWVDPILRR